MATALAIAASTKRVLLLAAGPPPAYKKKANIQHVWKTWNHAIGCEQEHPECFFEPVSNCNLGSLHKLMEQDKISYLEMEENMDLYSVPQASASNPRVIVIRGKHSWLGNFRRNLPVTSALLHLGVSHATRNNEFFTSQNRYIRNRMWSMQAAIYLLRLNQVLCEIILAIIHRWFDMRWLESRHPFTLRQASNFVTNYSNACLLCSIIRGCGYR